MVSVEIIETGEFLEIAGPDVTYVFQAADIGDVTKANASYSHNFTTPKTPHNTQILENLGIKGDTSTAPYRRMYCRLLDNGTAIVERGLMTISETTETYKISIQAGIIEFFRDVTNDKIGDILELSDLTHQNTPENIIASFVNTTGYKYLIADFRGPTFAPIDGATNLDPSALIPSINVGELLNRIMNHYGWTYEGLDFSGLWMTYPTTLAYDSGAAETIFQNGTDLAQRENEQRYSVIWNRTPEIYQSDFVYLQDTQTLAVERAGTYIIDFTVAGRLLHPNAQTGHYYYDARLYRNGQLASVRSPEKTNNTTTGEVTLDLQKGDTLNLYLETQYPFFRFPDGITPSIQASMSLQAVGIRTVNFREALIKYKVSDFFKELMIRRAAAVFTDGELKHLTFKTIAERTAAPIVDWSSRYKKRTNEKYTHGSAYAQNNYLRHKYDDEGEDFQDGNLQVSNNNLEMEKDLFQSQSYAPAPDFGILNTRQGRPVNINILKMFDAEVTTESGAVKVTYKGLKDRFFFVRETKVNRTIYIKDQEISNFPVATVEGATFSAVVRDDYQEIRQILNDTRIHNIELALSKYDVATLDLSLRYYFSQENAVYFLNRLTWKTGASATGEFIKLNA